MKMKKRRGATVITMIGISAVILLFGLFFLELQQMFDVQYAIEVRAQRAVNSTVEYAMDDTLRADGYNYLDIPTAQQHWKTFMDRDLNVDSSGRCYDRNGKQIYSVVYGQPEFLQNPARMRIKITVNMAPVLGKHFGMTSYSWINSFESTNFRTDDDERKGLPGVI